LLGPYRRAIYRRKYNCLTAATVKLITAEPTQPLTFLPYHDLVYDDSIGDSKKRGKIAWFWLCAYRFLSIKMITSPTAMIAMIAPAPIPKTYVSVMGAGVGVGPGVGSGASSTLMYVIACEGP